MNKFALSFCLLVTSGACIAEDYNLKDNNFVLYEAKSEQVLKQSGGDELFDGKNIGKLLLGLLALDLIRNEQLTWNAKTLIKPTHNLGNGPLLFLPSKKIITVQNMLELLFSTCANNIAKLLFDKINTSGLDTMKRINQRAKSLGMNDTLITSIYENSNDNKTTLNDAIVLVKHIYQTYPLNRYLYNQKKIKYSSIATLNKNVLLWKNQSVDGMFFCREKNSTLSLVTAKSPTSNFILASHGSLEFSLLSDALSVIISQSTQKYYTYRLFSVKEPMRKIPLYGTSSPSQKLALGIEKDIYYTYVNETGNSEDDQLIVNLNYPKYVWAPISQSQQIGMISVTFGIGKIKSFPLVALHTTVLGSKFDQLVDILKLVFSRDE